MPVSAAQRCVSLPCGILPGPTPPAGHVSRSRLGDLLHLGVCQRFGDDPLDQLAITDAPLLSLLGHKAERRHAGLRVHFQQVDTSLALRVVPAEIAPRRALAAEKAMG